MTEREPLQGRPIKDSIGLFEISKIEQTNPVVYQNLQQLLKKPDGEEFSLTHIARVLNLKVYESCFVIPKVREIRTIALDLGMTKEAKARRPRFSKREVIEIATEFCRRDNIDCPVEISKKLLSLIKKGVLSTGLIEEIKNADIKILSRVVKKESPHLTSGEDRKNSYSFKKIIIASGNAVNGQSTREFRKIAQNVFKKEAIKKRPKFTEEEKDTIIEAYGTYNRVKKDSKYSLKIIIQELGYVQSTKLSKEIREIACNVLGKSINERFPHFTEKEAEKIKEAFDKEHRSKRKGQREKPYKHEEISVKGEIFLANSKPEGKNTISVETNKIFSEITKVKPTENKDSETPSTTSYFPSEIKTRRFSIVESERENSPPLGEIKIYVIFKKLLLMKKELLTNSDVNTERLFYADEIKSLRNRIRFNGNENYDEKKILEEFTDLVRNGNTVSWKEYSDSCGSGGPAARILFSCFNPEKIGNGFWKEFLSVQQVSIQEATAGKEV